MTEDDRRGKPIDILLVEDNPGDVILTREALDEGKVLNNLYVAKNGVEAMSFLRQEGAYRDAPRPDLILLDLNLPIKDGREVLEETKMHPDLKQIPVIVLTTSRAESDILASYRLHANCYIAKPIDILHFVYVVKSIEQFWISIVKLPPKEGRVEPVTLSKS